VTTLVTGANGFAGPWLLRELLAQEAPGDITAWVWGGGLEDSTAEFSAVRTEEVDLRDPDDVSDRLADTAPDVIYHLAAASSVAASWNDPRLAFDVNLYGTLHLLDAVRTRCPQTVVVAPTSGEIYGPCSDGRPHREDESLDPRSPYAVSKAAQDLLLAQAFRASDIATVRLRPFVHTGPGRLSTFAESDFARQIAAIEAGRQPPRIAVGNLEAVRDVCDVRDVVRGYRLSADRRHAGTVRNLCRGVGVAMRDVLDILVANAHVDIEVTVDPDRLRPADLPALVGDPGRADAELGWRTEIPLDRTLADLLDWWRARTATT
jgi:GDP-4-dehydro-6-deoxy-D-mannose reductase